MLGFNGFLASDVSGYSGGIVVAWKEEVFNVDLCIKKFQFLHLIVRNANGKEWFFTPVYASPNEENRRIMWKDLKRIANSISQPWMLAGDFNDIACAAEKKGGATVCMRKCNRFVERINACKLLDLSGVGSKFTWRGPIYHGGGCIFERLDRALCNDCWRLEFPNAFVRVLTRLDFSDHHPILICPDGIPHSRVPRQFKFESAWLLENSYIDMLGNCWDSNTHISDNLQKVQQEVKEWKFHTLDQISRKKRELMARIGGIQRRLGNGVRIGGLVRLERKLQVELEKNPPTRRVDVVSTIKS